jgi:phosphotransacetylase
MIRDLNELIRKSKEKPARTMAVAAAEDEHVLKAVRDAVNERVIIPLLIGDKAKIGQVAQSIGFDLNGIDLLTSSLRHPKIFIKEFGDFLMPCHQHCLSVYILVQR